MKTTKLIISIHSEKLTATKLYLSQKGIAIEDELSKAVDLLYSKHVPVNVREFIELSYKQEQRKAKKPDGNTLHTANQQGGDGL